MGKGGEAKVEVLHTRRNCRVGERRAGRGKHTNNNERSQREYNNERSQRGRQGRPGGGCTILAAAEVVGSGQGPPSLVLFSHKVKKERKRKVKSTCINKGGPLCLLSTEEPTVFFFFFFFSFF
eukprot:Hpha_TRINITY_DN15627_c4_g1::TRINITY_DN15627_c4_g1_i1::g.98655::m.98655